MFFSFKVKNLKYYIIPIDRVGAHNGPIRVVRHIIHNRQDKLAAVDRGLPSFASQVRLCRAKCRQLTHLYSVSSFFPYRRLVPCSDNRLYFVT